jgi:hypothetical protein
MGSFLHIFRVDWFKEYKKLPSG